ARLIGFGASKEQAKTAAMKKALASLIKQVIEEDEYEKNKDKIGKLIEKAEEYMRTPVEFQTGGDDSKHYTALALTPRAAKLGRDLHLGGIEVSKLYDLVGQPSIGIYIPEKIDNKDMVKDNAIRRAQMRLEKALREAGMTTVDVTDVPKEKQREICDILITGTSQATQRWNKPLPGGTQPVYVYNTELALNIQLSPTKRVIFNEIFSQNPQGMEEIKKFGKFDSDEAAKFSIEANVEKHLQTITKSIIDEWVKLSGDIDYWVGISGLKGGMDVLNAKKELKEIKGVTKTVPRYYKDGTQYVGLVYPDTADKLIETMISTNKYTLVDQRGAMLVFKVVE
ncbi:MAG: hypothetical protein JXR97_02010, partial [Planctomycetes bacterium]|nr:hypothetical protein [Planctomycetota bacterium]